MSAGNKIRSKRAAKRAGAKAMRAPRPPATFPRKDGKTAPPALIEELEATRAKLARLERAVAGAPCSEVGHRWKLHGGANCGCHKDAGCSVPVYECEVCGDCDYGENTEASIIRAGCADEREQMGREFA